MKQHITTSDLNQLSPEAKERLRVWWKPEEGDLVYFERWEGDGVVKFIYGETMTIDNMNSPLDTEWKIPSKTGSAIQDWGISEPVPLLSIGQMIEFLDEHNPGPGTKFDTIARLDRCWAIGWLDYDFNTEITRPDLCDALWEAVKDVLSGDKPETS